MNDGFYHFNFRVFLNWPIYPTHYWFDLVFINDNEWIEFKCCEWHGWKVKFDINHNLRSISEEFFGPQKYIYIWSVLTFILFVTLLLNLNRQKFSPIFEIPHCMANDQNGFWEIYILLPKVEGRSFKVIDLGACRRGQVFISCLYQNPWNFPGFLSLCVKYILWTISSAFWQAMYPREEMIDEDSLS